MLDDLDQLEIEERAATAETAADFMSCFLVLLGGCGAILFGVIFVGFIGLLVVMMVGR